ncbi:VTC domain-containing protein [Paenibacillus profundus]|uniref:VTC domain-containing protein n=1 Tax=Paenibacillus profundus TaxID=1173085 RepID=A0ABS8YBI6_9BACL|nr:VTC domain-containing protein [Paenibacillus profundus]MCE5168931.1 VTC domain-containing protein [Paenibacillus profundus]
MLLLDQNSVDEHGYHIRSLYFDNIYESALHDKVDGILNRRKYRIRIYNKSDAVIKLERKSKWNEYVAKESAPMTRSEFERLYRGDAEFLREADSELKLGHSIKLRGWTCFGGWSLRSSSDVHLLDL